MADISFDTLDSSIDPSDIGSKDKALKQSILRATTLSAGSVKRMSSRAQIQWKGVKGKADDDRKYMKTSLPVLGLLASRGYRWHYIHDVMLKMRWEETKIIKQSDEHMKNFPHRIFNTLIRDFGTVFLQKRFDKNAELTLDQQAQLEVFKHRIIAENNSYLKKHPEIDLLLMLIYSAVFKNQPQDPKLFIANYVHHLNMHREELVSKEVDIPFDRPEIIEEISSLEKERQSITRFAQILVEKCVDIAMHGAAYINVINVISVILQKVSPSEDNISFKSAEAAVSNILSSLLTSVVASRKTDTELIADEILHSILTTVLPFVQRDNRIYNEMKVSIVSFVEDWVRNLENNVLNLIDWRCDTEGEKTYMNDSEGSLEKDQSKSILRKEEFVDDDLSSKTQNKTETRVKFQSLKTSI